MTRKGPGSTPFALQDQLSLTDVARDVARSHRNHVVEASQHDSVVRHLRLTTRHRLDIRACGQRKQQSCESAPLCRRLPESPMQKAQRAHTCSLWMGSARDTTPRALEQVSLETRSRSALAEDLSIAFRKSSRVGRVRGVLSALRGLTCDGDCRRAPLNDASHRSVRRTAALRLRERRESFPRARRRFTHDQEFVVGFGVLGTDQYGAAQVHRGHFERCEPLIVARSPTQVRRAQDPRVAVARAVG
jgi:hypothetical protein